LNHTKNRTPGHALSSMAYGAICWVVSFHPASHFTQLHALILATCSYVLLPVYMSRIIHEL